MRLYIEPIDLSAESSCTYCTELRNPERNSLKGQSHKIFQLGFFVNRTSPPRPRIHKLNHFRKQQRIRRDFCLFILLKTLPSHHSVGAFTLLSQTNRNVLKTLWCCCHLSVRLNSVVLVTTKSEHSGVIDNVLKAPLSQCYEVCFF
jgi:hypothetical protein